MTKYGNCIVCDEQGSHHWEDKQSDGTEKAYWLCSRHNQRRSARAQWEKLKELMTKVNPRNAKSSQFAALAAQYLFGVKP